MKKYLLPLSFLLFLTIGIKDSFAIGETFTRAPSSVIVGSTTGENAGIITFSNSVTNYTIDWTNKWAYIKSSDNKFYGYFWIENVGWATFEGLGANQAILSGTSGIVDVNGYAWSENAGWISFVNGVNDTKFNATTGKFSGYAWSENLGWIDMASISGGADITPPTFTSTIFAADNNKAMVINETNFLSGTVDIFNGQSYGQSITSTSPILNFMESSLVRKPTLRTSKSGSYLYVLEDKAGNKTSGEIYVTANVPSTDYTNPKIYTNAPVSTFLTTSDTKIGNGSEYHNITAILRDTYGNPVVNDNNYGLNKVVTVSVDFDNQIDARQFSPSSPLYYEVDSSLDTLKFNGTNFGLTGLISSGSLSLDSDGDYSFGVASYAPTSVMGGSGSLQLKYLKYKVTSLLAGVGETGVETPMSNKGFSFSPAFGVRYIEISHVGSTDGWKTISVGNEKTFTGITYNSGSDINTTAVSHILDIISDLSDNAPISFKNPSTTSTQNCYGYSSGYADPNFIYNKTADSCNYNNKMSSNINLSNSNNYKWTPTTNLFNGVTLPLPSSMDINYRSEVVYTYNNNGITVGHGSLEKAGGKVANRQIKVTGVTNNSSKNMITQSGSNNIKIVGTINKLDLKTSIYKNVETLTKNGVPSSSSISYFTTNQTINSWPSGKDTIIVKGANLFITGDIKKTSGKINAIVVLKDSNGNGGNIFVTSNVKFIAATMFADGGLISGGGSPLTYYADSDSLAQDQLFIKGSLITSNTIGGSFKNPQTCPYGVTPCNDQNSKRYDLNLFRHFIYGIQGTAFTNNSTYGYNVNMSITGYTEAPLIIEADKDTPPKVFQYNSTK